MQPQLTLLDTFQDLSDPRQPARCEHRLVDLLVIAAGTLLCGGEGFNDMELFAPAPAWTWLKTFLALPGGPPGHDTFNRLFQTLDPQAFLDAFARWVKSVRLPRPAKWWPWTARPCAGPCAPANRHATSSACGPRKTASCWASARWTTKATKSPPCPHSCAPWTCRLPRHGRRAARQKTIAKDHGRVEVRRYWQSQRIGWFADRQKWAGLRGKHLVAAWNLDFLRQLLTA